MQRTIAIRIGPVHLLRVFLLRVLESNFLGDSLSNSTDMIIPTPGIGAPPLTTRPANKTTSDPDAAGGLGYTVIDFTQIYYTII